MFSNVVSGNFEFDAGDRQAAPTAKHIRVLSVSDNPLVHDGIRALLDAQGDMALVGEVCSLGVDALDLVNASPHVVLLVNEIPGYEGVKAIARLRALKLTAHVVAISSDAGGVRARRLLDAGAYGYLLSCNVRAELPKAIRTVAFGRHFVDSDTAITLSRTNSMDDLNTREIQILELVAAGKANKEIAHELSTTEGAIKNCLKRILAKLDASDRTHAVVIGIGRGLIEARTLVG